MTVGFDKDSKERAMMVAFYRLMERWWDVILRTDEEWRKYLEEAEAFIRDHEAVDPDAVRGYIRTMTERMERRARENGNG
jgi:hypothetical protein